MGSEELLITIVVSSIALICGWILGRKTIWPEPHTHWHVEASDEAIARHITKITNHWESLYGYDIRTIKPGYYLRGDEIVRLSRRLGKSRRQVRRLHAVNKELREQLQEKSK